MTISNQTLLITGGGSGIGRALAEAFHSRGSRVIIAGRRQSALDEVTRANPGMASLALDIEDPSATKTFVEKLLAQHPSVNSVIHNAGIMRTENLTSGSNYVADAEATVATNLLGPIRLNALLLPHLLKQPAATIMTVTSGLAFIPAATFPTYCATKAAMHSYTESLRFQLRNTAI
ncbi:MAG TPA: SDR family NAD(P)-dependent oxidoreductase, partial [Opitutaceae bacterium]|nr:SDR family NAD(P)-dependent oxidoreductase [Opitutaceae bacterium]